MAIEGSSHHNLTMHLRKQMANSGTKPLRKNERALASILRTCQLHTVDNRYNLEHFCFPSLGHSLTIPECGTGSGVGYGRGDFADAPERNVPSRCLERPDGINLLLQFAG